MAARSKARKRAMDVLFEADQRGTPDAPATAQTMLTVLADRIQRPGTQTSLPEYAVQIVEGVAEHLDRVDEVLSTYSQGWTLVRMPAVDRAILRLASWEIIFNDEVPAGVAIDEAVELATSLSTDDSPAFVNGLLAQIAHVAPMLRD